jgi:hypothetical protein
VIPVPELFKVDWPSVDALNLEDDVQGWNSDFPIFDRIVAEANERAATLTGAEVGSWKGRSAIHLAKAMKGGDLLYCLDTWQGGIDHLLSDLPVDRIARENGYPTMYRQFLWNVRKAGVDGIVQPVVAPSAIGLLLLKAHKVRLDFAYVDGAHDHDGAYADLEGVWPLLRPGAVMFGDDVNMPGVHSAVSRFMSSNGIPTVVVEAPFWSIVKPLEEAAFEDTKKPGAD